MHVLCDRNGYPLTFCLTPGPTHEAAAFDEVMTQADEQLFDEQGEPLAWPVALAGDKGFRAAWIDDYLLDLGIKPVIPSKRNQDRAPARSRLTKPPTGTATSLSDSSVG